jgi:hypothetical protein
MSLTKDDAAADCVIELVKNCEQATTADRDRWKLAHQIFSGKYEQGPASEDRETEAKVGLHTFSKICRGAASAAQELLHQDPKFYDFVPPEGEEMDLFGKAIEKIHRYRTKELRIENHTYRFVLAGAIAGLGINKFRIIRNLEDDEEYLLDLLNKEREKESKSLSSDIKRDSVIAPEGVDVSSQLGILDLLEEGGLTQKKKMSKKGSKKLSNKISLKIVNPLNFYWDPNCEDIRESSWVAERYYVPFYMLEQGFKTGLFKNKEELLSIMAGGNGNISSSISGSDFQTQKMIYEDKELVPSPYTPIVEIIEYYGPVLEKNTGKILEEYQRIFIANSKVVLAHGPNPDWRRKSPYFFSTTSYVPFKGVGAGIADDGVDQELIGNEIMNLMLEHLAFNVKGVKAVDTSLLTEPEALESGFYPGQILNMRSDSGRPISDAFHDVDYNPNLTFSVMQMLEKLDLSASSAASVDTQGSNPSSRARISAAEINSNSNKTSRSQFTLARELDETYLEELLVRILDYILQYDLENQPLEEFAAAGIISESEKTMIASIPTHERLKEAKRRYRLDVRGFRERLERGQYLTRLSEYMQQIIMLLGTAPEMKDSLNFKKIIQKFSEAYGFNADDIVIANSPYDLAREENSFLSNDRQVEVVMDDEHAAHLPIHYDLAMRTQNEAIITHVVNHIRVATENGVPFPPVPPELEMLIYGPPEEEIGNEQQGQQDGGATVAGPNTFQ